MLNKKGTCTCTHNLILCFFIILFYFIGFLTAQGPLVGLHNHQIVFEREQYVWATNTCERIRLGEFSMHTFGRTFSKFQYKFARIRLSGLSFIQRYMTLTVNVLQMNRHDISNNVVCTTSKGSDQPTHTRSLIRAFASRLNILLVSSYHPNNIWIF